MAYSYTERKRIRKSFGSRESVLEVPYLLQMQKDAYTAFLQADASPRKRTNEDVYKRQAKPNSDKVGVITRAQLEEIAKTKMKDMTAADLDAAVRTIAGSARSMGVNVEGV